MHKKGAKIVLKVLQVVVISERLLRVYIYRLKWNFSNMLKKKCPQFTLCVDQWVETSTSSTYVNLKQCLILISYASDHHWFFFTWIIKSYRFVSNVFKFSCNQQFAGHLLLTGQSEKVCWFKFEKKFQTIFYFFSLSGHLAGHMNVIISWENTTKDQSNGLSVSNWTIIFCQFSRVFKITSPYESQTMVNLV